MNGVIHATKDAGVKVADRTKRTLGKKSRKPKRRVGVWVARLAAIGLVYRARNVVARGARRLGRGKLPKPGADDQA